MEKSIKKTEKKQPVKQKENFGIWFHRTLVKPGGVECDEHR